MLTSLLFNQYCFMSLDQSMFWIDCFLYCNSAAHQCWSTTATFQHSICTEWLKCSVAFQHKAAGPAIFFTFLEALHCIKSTTGTLERKLCCTIFGMNCVAAQLNRCCVSRGHECLRWLCPNNLKWNSVSDWLCSINLTWKSVSDDCAQSIWNGNLSQMTEVCREFCFTVHLNVLKATLLVCGTASWRLCMSHFWTIRMITGAMPCKRSPGYISCMRRTNNIKECVYDFGVLVAPSSDWVFYKNLISIIPLKNSIVLFYSICMQNSCSLPSSVHYSLLWDQQVSPDFQIQALYLASEILSWSYIDAHNHLPFCIDNGVVLKDREFWSSIHHSIKDLMLIHGISEKEENVCNTFRKHLEGQEASVPLDELFESKPEITFRKDDQTIPMEWSG